MEKASVTTATVVAGAAAITTTTMATTTNNNNNNNTIIAITPAQCWLSTTLTILVRDWRSAGKKSKCRHTARGRERQARGIGRKTGRKTRMDAGIYVYRTTKEEEQEQSLKLDLGQLYLRKVSDFIFLASAYEGSWPFLSLAVS